jgi:hypothetical protein
VSIFRTSTPGLTKKDPHSAFQGCDTFIWLQWQYLEYPRWIKTTDTCQTNCSLKSRHIQFIALGGSIGTGLFLGIGIALTQAGPLSVLLGYVLTGAAVFCLVSCILHISPKNRAVRDANISIHRCNVLERWLLGCPFLDPFLNFAPDMRRTLWDLLLDGT